MAKVVLPDQWGVQTLTSILFLCSSSLLWTSLLASLPVSSSYILYKSSSGRFINPKIDGIYDNTLICSAFFSWFMAQQKTRFHRPEPNNHSTLGQLVNGAWWRARVAGKQGQSVTGQLKAAFSDINIVEPESIKWVHFYLYLWYMVLSIKALTMIILK